MAALDDLLARIEDEALRNALERELAPLRADRELGLVFERHLPEKVRLPGLPIRRGATVEVRADQPAPTWHVTKVADGKAELRHRGDAGTTTTETHPVENLVVVREFGQPIYPGLKSVGRIERGGDKPFHTVINAENYHALETLLYTCEGQVDAIYIDPPYNTGARDWKYNNDYVDGNDGYRHSKWLSFMEKRLLLAKRLLNPDDSVLIVTIDEKEYLRLGLLLEALFPTATVQMVTIVINPKGTARYNEFARVEEYAFFVFLGDARLQPTGSDMLTDRDYASESAVRWRGLARTGRKGLRANNPGSWYPIFVNVADGSIHSIGDAIGLDEAEGDVQMPHGTVAVWPQAKHGQQYSWSVVAETLRDIHAKGGFKAGRVDVKKGQFPFYYLSSGAFEKIAKGEILVKGHGAQGELLIEFASGAKSAMPRSIWNQTAHDAGSHGTNIVKALVPGRSFPFPKSLYAVEDALSFFIRNNPSALVLDFFGGSGTTAHAVMRLNRQDGGQRSSIVVTNNEIGAEAEKRMTEAGKTAPDPEWQALGIFELITKPRLEAAVTGKTHDGKAVQGEYKFNDEFPMSEGFEENIEFFTLTYEDADRVRLGAAFAAVAPMLWLMAGAVGPRVDKVADGWALPDGCRYGVLFDADAFPGFVEAVKAAESVTHAFVVTDSDAVFQRVVAELPGTVTPVRLYESYLRSFAINTGVSA